MLSTRINMMQAIVKNNKMEAADTMNQFFFLVAYCAKVSTN